MDITQKLNELDASLKGDYWICRCPSCWKKEAFVYVNDVEKAKKNPRYKIPIRCNRANKCGVVSYIEDVNINEIPQISEEDIIGISNAGYTRINSLAKLNKLIIGYDIDWRGISNTTLKENGIIYLPKGFYDFISKSSKDEYAEKFLVKKCYKQRNLIIPIKDYEGECLRLLLRNTEPFEDDTELKEIGMRLVKKSSEIWNRIDLINPEMTHIFVTEGVPDGLSVKEVDQNIGVVSIPGVRKYRQLIKEIEDNYELCKSKIFVLCYDNDDAGREYEEKLVRKLDKLSITWKKFDTGIYKDLNQYLQDDRHGFKQAIKDVFPNKFKFRRTTPALDIIENTKDSIQKLKLYRPDNYGKNLNKNNCLYSSQVTHIKHEQ